MHMAVFLPVPLQQLFPSGGSYLQTHGPRFFRRPFFLPRLFWWVARCGRQFISAMLKAVAAHWCGISKDEHTRRRRMKRRSQFRAAWPV